jgi:hypothetical protein
MYTYREEINGVIEHNRRMEIMGRVKSEMMARTNFTDDIYGDIPKVNMDINIIICMHALNILKIIGAEQHIRETNRFEVILGREVEPILSNYINNYKEQIREVLKCTQEKLEGDIIKIVSDITNKAYSIKIRKLPNDNIEIINTWIITREDERWIQPYNGNLEDREQIIYSISN